MTPPATTDPPTSKRAHRYAWLEEEILHHLIAPRLGNLIEAGDIGSLKDLVERFKTSWPEATVNAAIMKDWLDQLNITMTSTVRFETPSSQALRLMNETMIKAEPDDGTRFDNE